MVGGMSVVGWGPQFSQPWSFIYLWEYSLRQSLQHLSQTKKVQIWLIRDIMIEEALQTTQKSQLRDNLWLTKEDFLVGEGLKLGSLLGEEGVQMKSMT